MHSARARLLAVTLTLSATLTAACRDSTGPDSNDPAWWEGAWIAVSGNGAPLPFMSERAIVTELVVILHPDSASATTLFRPSTFYAKGLPGELDPQGERTIRVTAASNDSVRVYGAPAGTRGQIDLTFRRKADTLVLPSYAGVEFKLVRSP